MRRPAFTVVEILVAMTLTLAVFAITLPFVRAQTRALGASAGRLDADQVARYAQRTIDADLRLAGAVAGQPLLVLAAPMAIAFNANVIASDTTDPGAVAVEPGAPASLSDAWSPLAAAPLPGTTRSYPAAEYRDADGATSRHETIQFFLHPDTISDRSDDYVLYRRVNARDSVLIVRNLQVPADSAFFSYHRAVGGVLTRVDEARLPLYWDSVAIDSIRSVGIRASGLYRDRLSGEVIVRTVAWTTTIPNAAGRVAASCGGAPVAPTTVVATKTTGSQPFHVRLTWGRSADDGTGASDVRQYEVLWRAGGSTDPWRALGAVAGTGATTYAWDHVLPLATGSREYGVRARDCSGASTVTAASAVTLP